MSETVLLSATCDTSDRLVAADAGFAAANSRAGGAIGEAIAIPQFATIVRLARRLGILVQRAVTVADAELDLDCWVRATPGASGVALSIAVLRERIGARAQAATATVLADAPAPPGADWAFGVDAQLRLTHLPAEAVAAIGVDPTTLLRQPLTRLFTLTETADGAMPLMEAMATRTDFDRQPATIRTTGQRVTLAGTARFAAGASFAGFTGGVFAADPPATAAPLLGDQAHRRLEAVLRAPLGRIVAAADLLGEGGGSPIDPHYADYAADIAHAGRHLLGLVDDLADLEAIERPDFAVAVEPLDLADVARRAAGLLAVRAADAGVRIDRGDAEQPFMVMAEFGRTLQIMVNLLGNAIRYSPRGGTVWIRLQNDGRRVAAIVADQGKGIAREDQARIFEKFERVDASEAGGSGLGLYIARRLARAMAGDLTVDSDTGRGARFVLTLPTA